MTRAMAAQSSGGWIGFAAMAFIIAGLSGVFATYALPIPMERAFALDATLDDALVAARAADPTAALEALRPRLGESADAVLGGPGAPVDRIQRERAAMRQRFRADAEATAVRLRWLCVMVSLTGAVFVGALMGTLARRPPLPPAP